MIKVGVIGAGHLGKIHLNILSNSKFNLIGFHDTDISNSETLAAEKGYIYFRDIDSLINSIDAAVIVSPTTTHFEIAKKCINSGKHVFVEKPLTTNSKEARIINEIALEKSIEKAAVNFSSIIGKKLPSSALEKTGVRGLKKFSATGVSVIIHPLNPKAPCAHLNIRFFEAVVGKKTIWWFGGGFDLTPYFINKRDVLYWKNSAKTLCNKYNKGFYKKYNNNCNKYFFLPHRNEPRGIGGIFFDQLNNLDYDVCKSFALSCAETFVQSYSKLFNEKKGLKFTKKERAFQLHRRGRYVEFNLLYDSFE